MIQATVKPIFVSLLAVLLNAGLFIVPVAQGATSVVVSGRVYNATTGSGYAGVTIALCNSSKTALTDSNGTWQALIPVSAGYCARVVSGVPSGLTGPVTLNRPDVGVVSTYENQIAGVNCYHSASCSAPYTSWDRDLDNNTDFIYRNAPVSTPAPTQAPTPVPTAAPTATPVPATPTPVSVAAPDSFTAKSGDATDVINLAWSSVPNATYRLERSVDQTTWTTVGDKITAISYQDIGLKPDVTYYYRLTAVVGGVSANPVTASAKTAAILATSTVASTDLVSSDGSATASVPNALIPAGASCNVEKSDAPSAANGTKNLVGTYQVTCVGSNGEASPLADGAIGWVLKLGDTAKGYTRPIVVGYNAKNERVQLKSQYKSAPATLTFDASSALRVAAVGVTPSALWLNVVAVIIVIVMIVSALLFLPLRHKRRMNYQEYLRQKYYNL